MNLKMKRKRFIRPRHAARSRRISYSNITNFDGIALWCACRKV
ncbi:hypothetical protein CEV31_2802 [Brucella thiophenivorans]|uniref:Uncharacterized protein n=1 Tax=Brucella thiophenivorans TaxID=571255 RepID=A0A256FJQ4_9HYPH|nr:hypothetical protein CEV31_2802 [Brucella thiophenivorans]